MNYSPMNRKNEQKCLFPSKEKNISNNKNHNMGSSFHNNMNKVVLEKELNYLFNKEDKKLNLVKKQDNNKLLIINKNESIHKTNNISHLYSKNYPSNPVNPVNPNHNSKGHHPNLPGGHKVIPKHLSQPQHSEIKVKIQSHPSNPSNPSNTSHPSNSGHPSHLSHESRNLHTPLQNNFMENHSQSRNKGTTIDYEEKESLKKSFSPAVINKSSTTQKKNQIHFSFDNNSSNHNNNVNANTNTNTKANMNTNQCNQNSTPTTNTNNVINPYPNLGNGNNANSNNCAQDNIIVSLDSKHKNKSRNENRNYLAKTNSNGYNSEKGNLHLTDSYQKNLLLTQLVSKEKTSTQNHNSQNKSSSLKKRLLMENSIKTQLKKKNEILIKNNEFVKSNKSSIFLSNEKASAVVKTETGGEKGILFLFTYL